MFVIHRENLATQDSKDFLELLVTLEMRVRLAYLETRSALMLSSRRLQRWSCANVSLCLFSGGTRSIRKSGTERLSGLSAPEHQSDLKMKVNISNSVFCVYSSGPSRKIRLPRTPGTASNVSFSPCDMFVDICC